MSFYSTHEGLKLKAISSKAQMINSFYSTYEGLKQ